MIFRSVLAFTMIASATTIVRAEVFDQSRPVATFRDRTGVSGKCLDNLKGPGASILAKYGVETKDGTFVGNKSVRETGSGDAKLTENVARLAQRLEQLNGGKTFNALKGLTVWNIPNLDILARQTSQGLTMRSDSTNNFANLAHELGHRVGHSGSDSPPRNWYGQYDQQVPQRCQFTHYCQANHGNGDRNEEFAEVFAAYVTNPDMLKSGTPRGACQEAYNFMHDHVFAGGEASSCGSGSPTGTGTVSEPTCDDPLPKGSRELKDMSDAGEVVEHVKRSPSSNKEMSTMLQGGLPALMMLMNASNANNAAATTTTVAPAMPINGTIPFDPNAYRTAPPTLNRTITDVGASSASGSAAATAKTPSSATTPATVVKPAAKSSAIVRPATTPASTGAITPKK